MEKDGYRYVCTFAEELEVIKSLEALGFDIRQKTPCCCDYDEPFVVTFTGQLLIKDKQITSEKSLYISKLIGNSVGINGIYPYIDEKGIIIRFSFSTIIKEEYPYERFNLFEQYKNGGI